MRAFARPFAPEPAFDTLSEATLQSNQLPDLSCRAAFFLSRLYPSVSLGGVAQVARATVS
jgi:hypothetical protein